MNFNLTRERNNVKNEKLTEEGIVNFIIENIFLPSIESISVTKSLSLILETDGSNPPKHVQISSKYVKAGLKYSIGCLKNRKRRKIKMYSELLMINIFMSDYAIAWDLRKDEDLEFNKEALVVKIVSLVAPKSSELWTYFRFLQSKFRSTEQTFQLFNLDHYRQIVGSHFSNYYLHNSGLIENINMSFDEHAEIVKKHVSNGSVVLRFCKTWCDRNNYECCFDIIKNLIIIYDQGLESLWRGVQFLINNCPTNFDSGVMITYFLEKILNTSVSNKLQLIHISRFITSFQNIY